MFSENLRNIFYSNLYFTISITFVRTCLISFLKPHFLTNFLRKFGVTKHSQKNLKYVLRKSQKYIL